MIAFFFTYYKKLKKKIKLFFTVFKSGEPTLEGENIPAVEFSAVGLKKFMATAPA